MAINRAVGGLGGIISQARRTLGRRNNLLAEVTRLNWGTQAEKDAMGRMRNRDWNTALTQLAAGATPGQSIANAEAAIAAEQTDLAVLNRNGATRSLRNTVNEANAFLNQVRRAKSQIDTILAERQQFGRFDSAFNSRDVATLLAAIPHATWNAAEIKAIAAQESGDFTITSIAGIDANKPGIQDNATQNRVGAVGIGQQLAGGRDEGIAWAGNHNVAIPSNPDPRRTPDHAIRLIAAYLGRITDIVYPRLRNPKPSGIELKKLIMAGYNMGPSGLARVVETHIPANNTRTYGWAEIRPHVPGETRTYVDNIVGRLQT